MRITENFNGNWLFRHGFDAARAGVVQAGESVRLPHSAIELPYNYFDETDYQKPFTYQKVLDWRADFEGREVSLVFDAAMADSVVYLNGREIIAHKDGYTPFTARLTPRLEISCALARLIVSPFMAMISPVMGSVTGWASVWPFRRLQMSSFLLNL